jgi:hypothetical protein
MPSPEAENRPDQQNIGKEEAERFYYQAARFPAGERPAGVAYFQIQRLIYQDRDCDLSVFRFQLQRIYHVAVLGEPPQPNLEAKLSSALANGQPTLLAEEVLRILQQRRAQATRQGPWVERHWRPGERL